MSDAIKPCQPVSQSGLIILNLLVIIVTPHSLGASSPPVVTAEGTGRCLSSMLKPFGLRFLT